jgi:hypothetical protein
MDSYGAVTEQIGPSYNISDLYSGVVRFESRLGTDYSERFHLIFLSFFRQLTASVV